MKRFKPILFCIAALVSIIIHALCATNKIALIRNYGYRSTQTWLTITFVTMLLLCTSAVTVSVIIPLIKKAKAKKLERLQEATIEANRQLNEINQRKEQAKLSVDNKLSDAYVYDTFKNVMEPWNDSDIKRQVSNILMQLVDMNAYQEKLAALITINGADSLNDTNTVLDTTEQGILLEVRKAINNAMICNPNNDHDVVAMREQLNEIQEYNNQQLTKVKDLLDATSEYLNTQSNHRDLQKIDLYISTIKEQVKDD